MLEKTNNQKILLVDDDSKNLQVAMNILKDFNVIYAQGGQKALDLLETNDFDLILLDIVMPFMSGFEVCRIIKSKKRTKDIPLIFLTVKDDEKDIVKGFDLGAIDYITKPFYQAVLLKRVETHLFLSKSLKDLKETVNVQVNEIRQKDKILYQESKIIELAKMVNAISSHWKSPLGLIKIHAQSLELKSMQGELCLSDIKEVSSNIGSLVDSLDTKISDFSTCFEFGKQKTTNIKVTIDSILFNEKDKFIDEKISLNIKGNISLKVNIVEDELKHIFSKLVNTSIYSFNFNKIKKRKIDIILSEDENYVYIEYIDNSTCLKDEELLKMFDYNFSSEDSEKGLGLYLTKIFVQKNQGEIFVKNAKDGLNFNIGFSKKV